MENEDPRRKPLRPVAVWDRDGGLLPALSEAFRKAGWELRAVENLNEWAAQHHASAVLLKITEPADWRLLHTLSATYRATVLVLLPPGSPPTYRGAFLRGAAAVARVGDKPAHIARTLQATMAGYALVPLAAMHEPGDASRPGITEEDKALLRGLSQGLTTDKLARRLGCSERTVYRRVRRVCSVLGVRTREEAVSFARRMGLLGPPPSTQDPKSEISLSERHENHPVA